MVTAVLDTCDTTDSGKLFKIEYIFFHCIGVQISEMDIGNPNDIFKCGHCSNVLGTIHAIIEYDLCAKHPCYFNHENIEIDTESKLVFIKKNQCVLPEGITITHSAMHSVPSTSKKTLNRSTVYQNSYKKQFELPQTPPLLKSPLPKKSINNTAISGRSSASSQNNKSCQPNIENIWSDDEVKALIDAYAINKHKFTSPMHNKKSVWEKISCHLKEIGINKIATKCDEKWRNLKKTYEKILEAKNKSGNHRVDWKFFDDFHELYFRDPHYNPISTASSSGVCKIRNVETDDGHQEKNSSAQHKRKHSLSALEIEQNKQKRHDEKIKLKKEIFQWFKENHMKK